MARKIPLLAGDYAEDYETMVPFQIPGRDPGFARNILSGILALRP